jgi:hypothetical protein
MANAAWAARPCLRFGDKKLHQSKQSNNKEDMGGPPMPRTCATAGDFI